MCDECGCGIEEKDLKKVEEITVFKNLLEENQKEADENREHLNENRVLAINLMGSPGSGKTSLIEKVALKLKNDLKIVVIEGDLATERDSQRLKEIGIESYQILTGTSCHLDAKSVHKILHSIDLSKTDILFVENVGNLVCPAFYDVGCHLNGVLLSVTEGQDKVLKYPVIFRKANFLAITKSDLLPYIKDFDVEIPKKEAKMLNGSIKTFKVSVNSEEGIEDFIGYILKKREEIFE